jgi:hypothetical protein
VQSADILFAYLWFSCASSEVKDEQKHEKIQQEEDSLKA